MDELFDFDESPIMGECRALGSGRDSAPVGITGTMGGKRGQEDWYLPMQELQVQSIHQIEQKQQLEDDYEN